MRVGPLLRVVVVVDATTDTEGLAATLDSVIRQTWPHLRCIVLGTQTEGVDDERIESAEASSSNPGDIASALLRDVAKRDLVMMLRSGDRLSRDCIYTAAMAAWHCRRRLAEVRAQT